MNLLEIKNQVIELLFKNPILEVSDFVKVKLPKELEPFRESLVRECLRDLEELKFVRAATKDGIKSIWLLEAPLGYSGQEIQIGLQTASTVASILNRWREATGKKDEFCNVMAISENDILNLCVIVMQELNQTEDKI